jgi:hypothetical protein
MKISLIACEASGNETKASMAEGWTKPGKVMMAWWPEWRASSMRGQR